MSASLVGSEMCIRDRGDHPHPKQTHRAEHLDAGEVLQVREFGPWPGLQSVSYTHLTLPTICSV
eukprot:12289509-Alexandrium_andersonii.AAC.1